MAAYKSLPYRPCVGVAVFNRKGRVFVGRRFDGPEHVDAEHAWQMPQGGIDRGEASLRGHLKAEGDEQTGSQSYIPPDPKDDKALHTALDLIRGIQKNSAYPPNPKTAVPN